MHILSSVDKLPAPSSRQVILQGGLFDKAYYEASYHERIPAGMDALTHFLAEGWIDGLKPNTAFDPLIYGLLHPGLGATNPLVDAASRYAGLPMPPMDVSRLLEATPRLASTQGIQTIVDDPTLNVVEIARYAGPKEILFEVDAKPYRFIVPAASEWLDRLEQNRPFAVARISQGDWDAIHAHRHYSKLLAAEPAFSHLNKDQRSLLAMRLCDEWHHDMDVYAENFLLELFDDLRNQVTHEDFLYCAAFKGYPTADERLFEWSAEPGPEDLERMRLFASCFAPDQPIHDATIWKRWMISGDLQRLPELMRSHPIILMAAEELSSLDQRWSLPSLLHIRIPASGACVQRQQLLAQCREKIAEAKTIARRNNLRQPVFLMQGSSFAYWFMKRLFSTDPDVFYLDFGQALHPWFYDCETIPLRRWGRLFGPTIVRNTGLESFYRERGISEPVVDTLFRVRR